MKINWKVVVIVILISILIGMLVTSILIKPEDKPFKEISLSYKNTIVNNTFPAYYDTILSVGLDNLEIMGITLELHQISDATKNKMEGFETKAHLRYYDGVYYLFADKWDRQDALEILSHELVHITQYHSGNLSFNNGIVTWKSSDNVQEYDLNNIQYTERPWEDEAFKKQNDIETTIKETLY